MILIDKINGNIILTKKVGLGGNLNIENSLSIKGNVINGGAKAYPIYDGPYIVTPKVYDQYLDTDNKALLEDVKVKEITYSVTQNEKGLTVQIGEI